MTARRLVVFPVMLAGAITSACAVKGEIDVSANSMSTSPWQTGIDLRVSPMFPINASGTEAGPTVAYERSSFDGGHDNILHLGGQIRFTQAPLGPRLWTGGEATYSRRTTVESGSDDEVTNGFRVGGLLGVRIHDGSGGRLDVYVSPGVVKYGGSGPSIRFGVAYVPRFR